MTELWIKDEMTDTRRTMVMTQNELYFYILNRRIVLGTFSLFYFCLHFTLDVQMIIFEFILLEIYLLKL